MPQTPADPLDGLGEAGTSLAIRLRGVGPAFRRLRDVLNPHHEMKPIEHVVSWTSAGDCKELQVVVGMPLPCGLWSRPTLWRSTVLKGVG
jgi:hypothetical protein